MSFTLSDSAKRALLQGPGAADPACPVKNGRLHYDAIRIEEYPALADSGLFSFLQAKRWRA